MKTFPEKLALMKRKLASKAPVAGVPVDQAFIRDLIRSGKAAERQPGKGLPPGAEYEIVTENGQLRLIHLRVSTR
jgi:hypothetical protein